MMLQQDAVTLAAQTPADTLTTGILCRGLPWAALAWIALYEIMVLLLRL